ncbi:MAG TPA: HYR domain-containing protein [Cyclobacteriaceae bacterium]|nr:HYR domain-containing protein [Cyclobacteriaceae bacterium]HRJ81151.1 HYR domain-containing protein [Cyclobacteriaceae bacterium]
MKVRVHCVLVLLFALAYGYSFGQNCDCPPVASCGACVGGLKSLSLRYTGATGATIRVTDGGGEVFNDFVLAGQVFSFAGTIPNEKFVGTTISIFISGFLHTTIQSACSGGTFVNSVYGLFTVTSGTSVNGGALCCAPGTTDQIAPVITNCPSNITLPLVSGCSRSVSWTPPSVSDNCGVASFTSTLPGNIIVFPGSTFPLGTSTVTYTALDIYNNSATCVFTVTITDNIPPVINGTLNNLTYSANADCKAIATWTPPTATDNCSVSSLVSSHFPGQEFNVGSTVVTYTARDGSNNVTNRTFTVTVVDNTAPVITNCPSNITLPLVSGCSRSVSWTPPSASDNCGVASFTSTALPGAIFSSGITTVTYTAVDINNNSTTCVFTVTIEDNTAPVIANCPASITVPAGANCLAVVNWTPPTASDNCGVTSFTSNRNPGTEFQIGTTVVTYTARDARGNETVCQFNVVVEDVTPPVISNCPSAITVPAGANCSATVNWTPPTASDNCGVTTFTSNRNPGSGFPIGTTIVTYTARDARGNETACQFAVVVEDVTPPIIANCPSVITVSAGANCSAIVNWIPPTASDNCGVTSFTSNRNPGSEFPIGTTSVTYTARDARGNETVCQFTVVVQDVTPPVIANCPSSITVPAGTNCLAIVNWTPPTASDNCGVTSFTSNRNPGTEFQIGTTVVTYTARDARGNETTCQFNVVVTYNQPPQLTGCPESINATAEINGEAVITWDEPVFTVACGTLTVERSHEPGSSFGIGTTEVVYTASDGLGNSAQCSFTITVEPGSFEIEIPKVITPNGDNANDTWVIKNIQYSSSNSVTVFDRWGSVIYQATGYNNDSVVWAGQNKSNTLVPTGTYFYIIDVISGNKKLRWEGFVELVQ